MSAVRPSLLGVGGGQMVWTSATAAVTLSRMRPHEIIQRIQRVAAATDVPLSCGEGIPPVVFTVNTL